jgi:hypothetical protein
LAPTDPLPLSANVQLFVLLPPLEHAPDQTAARPFVTLKVIEVPALKDAEPVLPTVTSMPTGFDVTRSPLRPDTVTVKIAGCTLGAGGVVAVTVIVVVLLTPL